MKFLKLTPEQKRERKTAMLKEYYKREVKLRKDETLLSLRIELAAKYDYKNEGVVEQTIIRDRKSKLQNA